MTYTGGSIVPNMADSPILLVLAQALVDTILLIPILTLGDGLFAILLDSKGQLADLFWKVAELPTLAQSGSENEHERNLVLASNRGNIDEATVKISLSTASSLQPL